PPCGFISLSCLRSLLLLILHSLPTRRSSDLLSGDFPRPLPGWKIQGARSGTPGICCLCHGERPDRRSDIYTPVFCWSVSLLFSRDRKSTRLNSSHVSISYAVFCLKKKRQN